MKLYKIEGEKPEALSSSDFKLEKDIQRIIEKNIGVLFSLQIVKTELTIKNFRMDTLVYNKERKSLPSNVLLHSHCISQGRCVLRRTLCKGQIA